MNKISRKTDHRKTLREEFWPDEPFWDQPLKGWFKAPRTLPLLLNLLSSKAISGKQDPARVYLELLARHMDEGFIELGAEADHAYAAGYSGTRGVRSWQERINILEAAGFIKTKNGGSQRYKYVLLANLDQVVSKLKAKKGMVHETWYQAYVARQLETGLKSAAQLDKERARSKKPTK
jgi:hypothetical protein